LKEVKLPKDAEIPSTFTIMDTSEEQVFMFVENRITGTPFGNLYISDDKGRLFTLSISNVVKDNSLVDFEKISSLDGTFIVNRYDYELPSLERPMYADDENFVMPKIEPVTIEDVKNKTKSYITHNKGATWELIKSPQIDSFNQPINCLQQYGCSLHFEIMSNGGEYAPVYSTSNAVGLVIGISNSGRKLDGNIL
jgi:hypothetical protein